MKNNITAPAWPKTLRAYIINQLATWKPYKDIWLVITNPEFHEKTGLEWLDPEIHNYDLFRMRCKRVPKNQIAIAHEAYQREVGAVRWAEEKARAQGLSDLIDKVNATIDADKFDKNTTGTMSAMIVALRGLYEQVRKEVSADKDREALSASGTRVLLANPKNVMIDANHLSELVLVYREEIGGLHNLDLPSLPLKELEQLRDGCEDAIKEKLGEITEAECETREDNENDDADED